MLIIDENIFRLAKMQETLLKVSNSNREENLNNYKKLVKEIDSKAFLDILEEIKHIGEHNHSLEEEVQFLETIKKAYDQLLELQSSFKKVCEVYGNEELELSDLTRLNIDYIEDRINTINGYLINLRNIDINKKKIQELSEQLVVEEKNKINLDNKLLEMEQILRNNFINAEGRFILNGQLQYASVVFEYKNLGYDFIELLNDNNLLTIKLSELEQKSLEINESLKVAEICYNSMLSAESKQILNEINNELLIINYKLTMLKIISLLSRNCVDYSDFISKREELISLIKYRLSCMKQMGTVISIDPFGRTKVLEQCEIVLSLSDSSKTINRIRKELSDLNSRTEEMISQNNSYLVSLNETRELITNRVGINDIDITSVELPLDDKKEIVENQIVDVKEIPDTLNMSIVSQKTSSVIKRVNQMMNSVSHSKEQIEDVRTPELVIVPSTVDKIKTEDVLVVDDNVDNKSIEIFDNNKFEVEEPLVQEVVESELQAISTVDEMLSSPAIEVDIFETVTPFEEPSLFVDKTDELLADNVVVANNELNSVDLADIELLSTEVSGDIAIEPEPSVLNNEEMPDAFWVTQEDVISESKEEEESLLSFDEQIKVLLSSEEKTDGMVKKRVA